MTEPVPPRHRRRERRRSRPAPPEPAPAGTAGETSAEYATAPAPPPVETQEGADAAGASGAAEAASGPRSAEIPVEPSAAKPAGTTAAAQRQGQGGDRPRPARRGEAEHGLRGIVGAGPSQVGVAGAMRARDAARPTAEDLAAAERDVVIVRRHYVPPDAP